MKDDMDVDKDTVQEAETDRKLFSIIFNFVHFLNSGVA